MSDSQYGIADLTADPSALQNLVETPTVDVAELRAQLEDIRDSLAPVVQAHPKDGFGLQKLEIALSIGVEGKVWFVAKGTAEASITLTFGPAAEGA